MEYRRTNCPAPASVPDTDVSLNCSMHSLIHTAEDNRTLAPKITTTNILKTIAEFRESAALLRSEYLRAEYINSTTNPIHPLELHPSSVTLGIKSTDGSLRMRASMVLNGREDWSLKLPCSVQPEFASVVEHARGKKAEVTRMASDSSLSASINTRHAQKLMTEIAMMSLALQVDRIYLVCHPRHVQFYVTCFEADEKATVASYAGIADKPGTLLEINTADFLHFTRWTPEVIEQQIAGPIGSETTRLLQDYSMRIQSTGAEFRRQFLV